MVGGAETRGTVTIELRRQPGASASSADSRSVIFLAMRKLFGNATRQTVIPHRRGFFDIEMSCSRAYGKLGSSMGILSCGFTRLNGGRQTREFSLQQRSSGNT